MSRKKGLEIYVYCLMSSHLNLLCEGTDGLFFLTLYDILRKIPLSNSQYGNNAEMRDDYDTNIGSVDGMNLAEVEDKVGTSVFLGNENNLEPGYEMDSSGGITNLKKETIPGYTREFKDKWYGKIKCQTTISPNLKGESIYVRNMVFKHEFMHAWHWKSGFSNFDNYSERATSQFSKD